MLTIIKINGRLQFIMKYKSRLQFIMNVSALLAQLKRYFWVET